MRAQPDVQPQVWHTTSSTCDGRAGRHRAELRSGRWLWNGFKFYDASGEALLGTLRWALHVFHNEPERWRDLQRAGMTLDFSWGASARAYLSAYDRARAQLAERQGVSA